MRTSAIPATRRRARLLSACLLALAPIVPAGAMQAAVRAQTPAEQAKMAQITRALEVATAERRWADAVALGRQALAIEEATNGPEHPEVAGTLGLIASWLDRQDKFAEATPLYERSLAIFRRNLGDNAPLSVTAANNLASNYQSLGRFDDAQPIFQKVLDASIAAYGPKHRRVALAYNNLGHNLARQGRYLEAKGYYDQALGVADATVANGDLDRALIVNNVAVNMDALGRSIEAEPYYRQALAIRVASLGEKDGRVAASFNNLGYNLNAQGRYLEAAPAYRKALDIRVSIDPSALATATSYNNVAHNLNRRGEYAAAAPYYAKALAIWVKVHGPDHPVTAIGYSNVAVNMERMGKAAEAQPLFERALKIRQAKLGATHPDIATGQIKLAHNLASQKKYAQATPLYEKAVAARRALLGPQHPGLAEGLTDQAELLADMGAAQRPKAVAAAREAVEIVRARRASRLSGAASGDASGVQQTLTRANAEDATRIDPLAGAFAAFLRASWLRAGDNPAEADALRAEAFTSAQDLGTSAAAQTMTQTAARAAAGSDALANLVRRQQDLSERAREIDGRLLEALTSGETRLATAARAELAKVGASLTAANRQLRKDFPDYAELVQPGALSVADTQARLQPDEAVLMIISSGADVYSFAVTKGGSVWSRYDGGAAKVDKAVERLRCQVDPLTCPTSATDADLNAGATARSAFVAKGYAAFDRATAFDLYRNLVAPVEGGFKDSKLVHVVTSGALAGLPLGLLPTSAPAAGEDSADPAVLEKTPWLADRYALSSLPSVSVLRALRRQGTTSTSGFIGYGAPVLDGPDKAARGLLPMLTVFDPAGLDGIPLANPAVLRSLSPLPGTATELSAMARTLKSSARDLHLGAKATEASVRSDPAIRKAGTLAFATHGILPGELSGLKEPGLVFTPPANPSPRDDGLLTASEVSKMNLSADWVILSACNTASSDGTPGADSLSSLARSFLYAGAASLLASHWRVADDSTAALTVETLGLRQRGGVSRAEALKTAMTAIRTGKRADGSAIDGWTDAWAHPAAWAPFTIISNGEK